MPTSQGVPHSFKDEACSICSRDPWEPGRLLQQGRDRHLSCIASLRCSYMASGTAT